MVASRIKALQGGDSQEYSSSGTNETSDESHEDGNQDGHEED